MIYRNVCVVQESVMSQTTKSEVLIAMFSDTCYSEVYYIGVIPTCYASQRKCFIFRSSSARFRIPNEAKFQCWFEPEIIIPTTNRVCKGHLQNKKFRLEALQE